MSPPGRFTPEEMTILQRHFMAMLTDQRVANLFLASDIIGDMGADGLTFLRNLSNPEHRAMRRFLLDARPEVLTFLSELRKDELENIAVTITTAIALRRALSFVKWGIITMFGAFVGMALLWEKLSMMLKGHP